MTAPYSSPDAHILNPAACERARLARDARFDGRFFVGVTSTGIYCRPICPVRLPKPENVRFYLSAAAAAAQGFRPCLRCRPELAPDNPYWPAHPPLVREALRQIDAGALDREPVVDLARRLGITDRHLRRLFLHHVGASPKALAQTRRILFAKQLISDSTLPLGQIASAAGFGSVRRFNAAFSTLYQRSPSSLRRGAASLGTGGFRLKLAYRPPYNWPQVRAFLRRRAIPQIEEVGESHYARSFELRGEAGWFRIAHQPAASRFMLHVEHSSPSVVYSVAERCKRLLDLSAMPTEISAHLRQDPRLADILQAQPGLRLPGAWDRFELCVRAILGQQITLAAARTLATRLVQRCTASPPQALASRLVFPGPAAVAAADLSGLGLTGRRITTLQRLAQEVLEGRLVLESADPMAIDRALAAIPGIGPWTRAYIAMRGLGDPDAFPSADIVLRKALAPDGRALSAAALETLAECWRPWRAYAAVALWHRAGP